MSDKRVMAVVRVTMDVEADSVWTADTTWEQIAKQAEDSVRGVLTNNNPLSLVHLPRRISNLQMVEVKVVPA